MRQWCWNVKVLLVVGPLGPGAAILSFLCWMCPYAGVSSSVLPAGVGRTCACVVSGVMGEGWPRGGWPGSWVWAAWVGLGGTGSSAWWWCWYSLGAGLLDACWLLGAVPEQWSSVRVGSQTQLYLSTNDTKSKQRVKFTIMNNIKTKNKNETKQKTQGKGKTRKTLEIQ